METINLGIVAHVDAGKTTITEQILYLAGAVRNLGSVDKGTAQTDFMEVERRRGISVRAASTSFSYRGIHFNLIDTPGHTDFSAETDRVLRVLDCAVLVISAVEGIQARTEYLWNSLKRLGIPVFFFINKTDRSGADLERVLQQIGEFCTKDAVLMDQDLMEEAAQRDDELLEKYLEGEKVSQKELDDSIRRSVAQLNMFPVIWGSALKGVGVDRLMDCICDYASPAPVLEGGPSGVIFKVEHDPVMGRIAHVRLYSGSLKSRDVIENRTAGCLEKITQIRKFYGKKNEDIGQINAGDIASLCGLNASRAGDILGSGQNLPPEIPVSEPPLRVRLYPEQESDYSALVTAMEELKAENPGLGVIWDPAERQLLVNITGTIQAEVLQELIQTRFGLGVTMGEPSVIYKETPSSEGFGYVAYTMPKPCWAVLKFYIQPGSPGSGVEYKSLVPNDKLFYRYQAQVEQALATALQQGPKGWEVTDAKITLVDGEHHTIHTHPLDFIVATPMGIMDGLTHTGTTLLEPMYAYRITAPEECVGKILGDLVQMRGVFDSPVAAKGTVTIEGRVPVATSMDYAIRLASITGGRGVFSVRLDAYQPCGDEQGKTTPYRGINPLDREKYILWVRSALNG